MVIKINLVRFINAMADKSSDVKRDVKRFFSAFPANIKPITNLRI